MTSGGQKGPGIPRTGPIVVDDDIEGDFAGRDRLAWNVLTSWAGHLVFVAAGFLMPRLIDRSIGQAGLGVWDFAWTMISYFSTTTLGIGSSVNRYVARHHAAGDDEELRKTVTSVMAVNVLMAVLILCFALITAYVLPSLVGAKLGEHTEDARWVIALLGVALAVQTALDAYRGVITGLHRWDLHNAINSGFYALTVVAMVAALKGGYGLRGLAAANAVGTVLTELFRAGVAYRVCPGLRVAWKYASADRARRMFVFGGKTFLEGISRMILVQGNALVVTSYLGPAVLAVYTRPGSLIRHAESFMAKFAHVLTPTASSLQGTGRAEDLRRLLVTGTRLGTALVLPMLAYLAVMADPILETWMGSRYEHGLILAILAVGALFPLTQHPTVTILTGLNLHGRVAVITITLALGGVLFGALAVGTWGLGLVGAALGVAIPPSIMAFVVARYACHSLGLRLFEYLGEAYTAPLLCGAPFVAVLLALRYFFRAEPIIALALGLLAAPIILLPLYWQFLLPGEIKKQVLPALRRFFPS